MVSHRSATNDKSSIGESGSCAKLVYMLLELSEATKGKLKKWNMTAKLPTKRELLKKREKTPVKRNFAARFKMRRLDSKVGICEVLS